MPARRPALSSMITGPVNARRLTRGAFLRVGSGQEPATRGLPHGPPSISTPNAGIAAGLPALMLPEGLGVNLHPGSTALTQITRLAGVGFRLARLDLLWDRVERRRWRYNLSPYEPVIEALRVRSVCRAMAMLLSAVAGLHTDARPASRRRQWPTSVGVGSSGNCGMGWTTYASGHRLSRQQQAVYVVRLARSIC